MATKHTRLRFSAEISDNSDYSRPYVDLMVESTLSPDEYRYETFETNGTSATTYDLGQYGDDGIAAVFLENLDSTNFVAVTSQYSADSDTNVFNLDAGEWVKLVDIDEATDFSFTADTAAVEIRIIIVGT